MALKNDHALFASTSVARFRDYIDFAAAFSGVKDGKSHPSAKRNHVGCPCHQRGGCLCAGKTRMHAPMMPINIIFVLNLLLLVLQWVESAVV